MSTTWNYNVLELKQGKYYLLNAPLWSDSGYIVAHLESIDEGVPIFVDDPGRNEIPFCDVDGWLLLSVQHDA